MQNTQKCQVRTQTFQRGYYGKKNLFFVDDFILNDQRMKLHSFDLNLLKSDGFHIILLNIRSLIDLICTFFLLAIIYN